MFSFGNAGRKRAFKARLEKPRRGEMINISPRLGWSRHEERKDAPEPGGPSGQAIRQRYMPNNAFRPGSPNNAFRPGKSLQPQIVWLVG